MLEGYSLKDNLVGTFWPPMYFPHLVEFQRALRATMKDPNNKLSQSPQDYSVYLTGKFNQDEGVYIINPSGPQFIFNLSAFINSSQS